MTFLVNPYRFVTAGGGGGTISVVQSAYNVNASANDLDVTLTGVTSGNSIVVIAIVRSPGTVTLTDDNSNTYTQDFAAGSFWDAFAYSVSSANSGDTVITIDPSNFSRDIFLAAFEVENMTGYDTTATLIQPAAQDPFAHSVTPTSNDSIIFGLFGTPNSDSTISSPPGGDGTWTGVGVNTTDPASVAGYQFIATAASTEFSVDLDSSKTGNLILAVYN